MILTEDQLKQCMHGVLSWEAKGAEAIPRRFTDKQLAVYAGDEVAAIRARGAAGMVFACRTDAKALTLDLRLFPASSEDRYDFDLLLDGALYAHREGKTSGAERLTLSFPLPGRPVRLELYFPTLAGIAFREAALSDASPPEPLSYSRRLLCAGDSITQGVNARFPSMTYVNRLGKLLDAETVNQGVGWGTFVPDTVDPGMAFHPDLITVAFGTNDWTEKPDPEPDAREYLKRMAQGFLNTPVFVLTPIWRNDWDQAPPCGMKLENWRTLIRTAAAPYPNLRVLDGNELFPPVPELFEDGRVHPGDAGFLLLAARIADRILAEDRH